MSEKPSMRILLVTHFLPPSHTAGTEQYTLGLGKELRNKGYDVHILCAEDWDSGQEYWNGVTDEVLDGLKVHRVHLNWMKAKNPNLMLYDSPIVERWLDEFLALNRFDLVHVTSTYSLGVGILRSAKRANLPLILTLMDFWFLCPSLQLLRSDNELCDGQTTPWQCQSCLLSGSNLFRRIKGISLPNSANAKIWGTLAQVAQVNQTRGLRGYLLNMSERKRIMSEVFKLPDLVISPSSIVREMFEKNGFKPVELLPYGHDLTWVENYSSRTRSDRIRFGYLGQIQKIKGVHLIIDAYVRGRHSDKARLDIWGDYSRNAAYLDELNAKIGNSSSIYLRGRYERKQLATILSDIDVVLVPSIWYENAPLVIQEAFASRTPVIASNLGGMAEAVKHEVNGLLFTRNDVDDLSRQMNRIVNEPGLLEKLAVGIPSVKSFKEEVQELESIYKRLIHKSLMHSSEYHH